MGKRAANSHQNRGSVQIKLARKLNANERQRNLEELYEVLAPGTCVSKLSPRTTIIKEPNHPEVRVKKLEEKLGTKEERGTQLAENIVRRQPKLTEKPLEEKITAQKRDLKRKQIGDQKIKRSMKSNDDVSKTSG